MHPEKRSTRRKAVRLVAPALALAAVSAAFVGHERYFHGEAVTHLQVPEGFTIERVAGPEILSYPMFAILGGPGRLFVFESTEPNLMTTEEMLADPSYHIRVLEDVDGDGSYDRSKIFADELPFPKGGVFRDGSLYVSASPDLLRFRDTDGDWVADEREVVVTGWVLNRNGAALGGPFPGPDGWLYLTDARRGFEIRRKEGDVLSGRSARIWRVRPDGTGLEWISGGGYDNAVELVFMPSGETIGTMTFFAEAQNGLRDAVMHWVEGGVYPKPQAVIQQDSLKLTGDLMPVMTRLARVAPSGIERFQGNAFGAGFHGNLFSVQFNTGRMLRHVVTPDGATFRTEDTPFMTSNSPDVHPTDVLQDADGSLLVLETGGWFINGCPLSRVAKPDVQGGIYRIRKAAAPAVRDPWGRSLRLATKTPTQLVSHLGDPRAMVREQAVQRLVALGGASVAPLGGFLRESKDAELRAAAVFALYRIGTPAAKGAVRSALADRSPVVRTAAARLVGMSRDPAAVDRLMAMVRKEAPPVRRQAATALGQIGDRRAIPALIRASADADDRFVEHAVIYSLITLGDPNPLVAALDDPSPAVRRAALIALDQMDRSPLRREHLAPFLASADPLLWNAGIWVASHHPDWSDAVVDFLARRVDTADLPAAETASVRDLMVTFCTDPQLQALVANRLDSGRTSAERKILLLDVIDRCGVPELPTAWVREIGAQLRGGDPQVRARALRVIESRGVTALQDDLAAILADPATPAAFRLDALSALVLARKELTEPQFRLLARHLDAGNEAPIRQLAAKVLAQADLTEAQLLALAREQVARSDVFLLPRLVEAFEGSGSAPVGESLVGALLTSTDRLENVSEEDLTALLATFPASVRQSAQPLLAAVRKRHEERLVRLQSVERALGRGDVDAGRRLFEGKALCSSCHAVVSEGGDFGPDLSNIGEIRSRHDILEAILYPSVSFAREYETYRVKTKSTTYTGIVAEQLADGMILSVGPGGRIRIPQSDVVSVEPLNVSMMPPGLDRLMSPAELADLIAYLESLPPRLDRLIRNRERQ